MNYWIRNLTEQQKQLIDQKIISFLPISVYCSNIRNFACHWNSQQQNRSLWVHLYLHWNFKEWWIWTKAIYAEEVDSEIWRRLFPNWFFGFKTPIIWPKITINFILKPQLDKNQFLVQIHQWRACSYTKEWRRLLFIENSIWNLFMISKIN